MCSQGTWSCVSSAPKVLYLAPQHPALRSGPALPFSWRGWAELLHCPPGCLLTAPHLEKGRWNSRARSKEHCTGSDLSSALTGCGALDK